MRRHLALGQMRQPREHVFKSFVCLTSVLCVVYHQIFVGV